MFAPRPQLSLCANLLPFFWRNRTHTPRNWQGKRKEKRKIKSHEINKQVRSVCVCVANMLNYCNMNYDINLNVHALRLRLLM